MSLPLSYCADSTAVLSRLRRFYEERPPDMILARLRVPSPFVAAYARGRSAGYVEYPDPVERARFWDGYLREQSVVHDDWVPNAYPSEMDQGLYGGLLGGQTQFLFDPNTGWISSMVAPILKDLAAAAGLRFTEDHPWWARYRRHLDAFVTAGRGKFGVSHLILINGLNFVFELVGAMQTYIELLERPDLVRQALALSFTVNRRVQEAFFEQVPLVGGGTCSFQCHWLPGRVLCESVDPFHMTSVDYFEQWGREPLERAFDCFDGGVTHLHGNGRHLLEAVATVRGLKALSLGDDRGYPSAFDLLPELRRRAGDLPLTVGVPYPDFAAALAAQRLTGGVLYDVTDVPDADTANRCMEAVRAYRAG